MAIDPNSISPKDIKKLVVEGMVFQPDGGMRVERVKTSDDPVIAKQEMKALEDTATAWRKVHDFTKGMDDDTYARRQVEATKLRDELLAMAANTQPAAIAAGQRTRSTMVSACAPRAQEQGSIPCTPTSSTYAGLV